MFSFMDVQISISMTESELHTMYPDVFKSEIGHCTKFKVHLQLKPQAVPVFCPLDNELNRLEREGIIIPVNFSEWAAPIVVVKKASGDLRICGDYSTLGSHAHVV